MAEEVITKTTRRVYKTEVSGGEGGSSILATTYRPSVTPRNVIIHRSIQAPLGSSMSSSTIRREKTIQYGNAYAISPSSYAPLASSGVSSVKNSREREKKDMQDLNERFASYIEKASFFQSFLCSVVVKSNLFKQ